MIHICTHAEAGNYHRSRVSKKEQLIPESKPSMRRRLLSRNLETDSPYYSLSSGIRSTNFSYPDIKGLDNSLCPSKRAKLTKADLGNAPRQKRCNKILYHPPKTKPMFNANGNMVEKTELVNH